MSRYYPYGVAVVVLCGLALFFSLISCAAQSQKIVPPVKAAEEKKPETTPPPVAPIKILEEKALAYIDPVTLKVTYEKGVDPRKVVDYAVRNWAQAVGSLQACQQQLQQTVKK